jgi:hypothetical protein
VVFVIIILLACIGSIVAYIQLKKGEIIRFETPSTPQQVIMTSVAQVGTARRWATVSQGDKNAVFSYHRRPSIILTIFFLIFGIIPGVVYWLIRSKRESLNVMIDQSDRGATIVQIVSNGYQGKSAGRAVRDALGVTPGTAAFEATSDGSIPSIPSSMVHPGPATIPGVAQSQSEIDSPSEQRENPATD